MWQKGVNVLHSMPPKASLKPFEDIRNRYNTLTKQQKVIADFILNKGLEVAFMSCNQLAQESGASPATVIRFTQSLGYKSYLDFAVELHALLLEGHRPMSKLKEAIDIESDEAISLERANFFEIESISDLTHLQQEPSLLEAIRLLSEAKRIYVTAARSAYSLAAYSGFLLKELVNAVQYFPSGAEDAYERLEAASTSDVLLVITFRRYARTSFRLAQFAAEHGVKIIALTDVPTSPVAGFSDVVLYAPNKMPFFSYVAPMAVLDALIWGFSRNRSEEITATLEKRQKMLLEQKVFI